MSNRLINDVSKLTDGDRTKIRKRYGFKTTKQLIKSVEELFDLGISDKRKEKLAFRYYADEFNKDILEARDKKKIEVRKKKAELKKKVNMDLKKNTRVFKKGNPDGNDNSGERFYDLLKSIHKSGDTINVVKKGGLGKVIQDENEIYDFRLDFSYTFTDKFKKDYQQIFTKFLQADSDTTKILGDYNYTIYINVGEIIEGKKIIQAFKEGVTNCLFNPIIKWCEYKANIAETKKTQYKYTGMITKLLKDELDYRDTGVTEEDMNIISNRYQINIEVNTPFQKNFIVVKSDKKALTTFKFINTRLNHVEHKHNEIVNLEYTEITQAEMQKQALDLKDDYHIYTKNMNGISSLSTLNGTYVTPSDYRDTIKKFENDTGIVNYYLDDFVDIDVSKFIRQGVHFNETIDFKDVYHGEKYNHYDMEKAYAGFNVCKYFKGFLGKVTDYRQTDKIVGLGYYRIDNINFDNANPILKNYNDKMKIYTENVYPSFELDFLTDNGVSFDIIEGCWGTDFDFKFNDDMLNNKDNGTKYYCKYCGSMFSYSQYKHFYMNCDKQLAEHIVQVSDYDLASYNSQTNELQVSYKKQHNNHLSHICGFITGYMRLNVLEQLFNIDVDKVVRVCVDGVYYEGEPVEMCNVFRDKPEMIKCNSPSETYISNYECDIKLCVNKPREHYKKELHKGVGGSGKTHLNIYDKGLIKKLFVAPSWKLSRNKNVECGIANQVWANLYTDDPEKIDYIKKNYNTLIIDEISMMDNTTKEYIFDTYSEMKIIMCGDNGYQLPPFSQDEEPIELFNEDGFDNIIQYNINRRCKCEELQLILDICRENIDDPFLYLTIKKAIKKRINKEELKEIYKKEDMILCRTHVKKDVYNEILKDVEKYYILKTDRKYCKGGIVYEKPDDSYKQRIGNMKEKEADYEVRHAYTIHSIQGETAKFNLFIDARMMESEAIYTALSRAEYLHQIYFVSE